jgi:hypothetical protein
MKTILEAANDYIASVSAARSAHTASTYQNAVTFYLETLHLNQIDPKTTPVDALQKTHCLAGLCVKKPRSDTERLYLTAVNGFFAYLAAKTVTGQPAAN